MELPDHAVYHFGVVLFMVLVGGKSIINGTMLTGELTSIIVYALQILMSLMMVTFVFVMIMIAEASTDRIQEVLEEVPEMIDDENALAEVANGDIDFEHVDFSYSGEGGNLSLKMSICILRAVRSSVSSAVPEAPNPHWCS